MQLKKNIQIKLNFDSTKELRSLHDGRRTYATLQYFAGVNIRAIQRQLGHSNPSQTWDYIKDIVDVQKRGEMLEIGNINLNIAI